MRFLIIEQDKKTSSYLRKGLKEQGFLSEIAATGEDGLHYATSSACDLIILDMVLPDINGWSVLVELRKRGLQVPIICISGRDSVKERVRGLELGADDFLVIPFAFSELLARIRAVLRRGMIANQDFVRIGDLEMDFLHHRVRRRGQCIDLTAKEFLLLGLLTRHAGQVLSRTFIAEQVWDMNFECDSNVVDVVIRRLRKKVDSGFEEQLIHTIRGIGYVLDDRSRSSLLSRSA